MVQSLSFRYGFIPKAWKNISDVMLLKKAGVYWTSKMRMIILMNAEFNLNNKKLGKELMEHAKRNKFLQAEQYGTRKRHSLIRATLNKRLTADIRRTKKLAMALAQTNMKSYYNLVSNNIALLVMRAHGAPKEAVLSMFKTLQ